MVLIDDDSQERTDPATGMGRDPALGLLCRGGGSGRLLYLPACYVMRCVRRSVFPTLL